MRVPESCLLDRYSYIDAAGRRMVRRQQGQEHAAAPAAVRGMMMIGQRLFSGRVAVAQVAPHAHTRARACMRGHTRTHTHEHACASIVAVAPAVRLVVTW